MQSLVELNVKVAILMTERDAELLISDPRLYLQDSIEGNPNVIVSAEIVDTELLDDNINPLLMLNDRYKTEGI